MRTGRGSLNPQRALASSPRRPRSFVSFSIVAFCVWHWEDSPGSPGATHEAAVGAGCCCSSSANSGHLEKRIEIIGGGLRADSGWDWPPTRISSGLPTYNVWNGRVNIFHFKGNKCFWVFFSPPGLFCLHFLRTAACAWVKRLRKVTERLLDLKRVFPFFIYFSYFFFCRLNSSLPCGCFFKKTGDEMRF